MLKTADIRQELKEKLWSEDFVTDKTGVRTVEIVGTSFIADEEAIIGEVNKDYVKREIEWYNSMSLNVNDIPGLVPAIWKSVSTADGFINSNYGWCISHKDNYYQYDNVIKELQANRDSRRAIMIYTRPSMWNDYNRDGMSDFMCTNTVQYLIREDKLHAIVNMRSNDAVFGMNNDLAWQRYVQENVANHLKVDVGKIYWQTGSLHVYERHFYLLDHFGKTGELYIKKSEYQWLYPNSPWA